MRDLANGQLVTDGYIYAYGTPSGRGGTAYLSRVNDADILDQTNYQYWNGSTWATNNPAAATPILPGTTSAGFFGFFKTTTYPSVGEMSVQYNAYEKKYIMLYADQNNNVVMRKADRPEGPWSATNNFGHICPDARVVRADDPSLASYGERAAGRTPVPLLEPVDLG